MPKRKTSQAKLAAAAGSKKKATKKPSSDKKVVAKKAKKSAVDSLKEMLLGKPAATPNGKNKAPKKSANGKKKTAGGAIATAAAKAPTPVKKGRRAVTAPPEVAPVAAPAPEKKGAGRRKAKAGAESGRGGRKKKERTEAERAAALSESEKIAEVRTLLAGSETQTFTQGIYDAVQAKRAEIQPGSELYCREPACESLASSAGYCRLHYIRNWKRIKRKEMILKEGKLNQFIEELVSKYPEKYLEAIRHDLASDKEFNKVVSDLELEVSTDDFDFDTGESLDSLIEGIRREPDEEEEF